MFEGQDVGDDANDETAYGGGLCAADDEEVEFEIGDIDGVVDPLQGGPLVGCVRGTHTETDGVASDYAIGGVWVVDRWPRVALVPARADVPDVVAVRVGFEVFGVGQVVVGERAAFGPDGASQPGAGLSIAHGSYSILVHCVFRYT